MIWAGTLETYGEAGTLRALTRSRSPCEGVQMPPGLCPRHLYAFRGRGASGKGAGSSLPAVLQVPPKP